MADLPAPVGITTRVSWPSSTERIAWRWPGRSRDQPNVSRAVRSIFPTRHPTRMRSVRAAAELVQARHDLAPVEVDRLLLVVADLVHEHVVVAGVHELPELGEVRLGVGPAGHQLGHHVLGDGPRGLLEVLWQRQLLAELARDRHVRPHLQGGLARLFLALGQAEVELAVGGTVTAGVAVALDELLLGRGADQPVAAA